jgi:hypothetical protein
VKATLELEYIGADSADWLNAMCRQFDQLGGKGFGERFIGRASPGPWVAEIIGKYPSGKLQRNFVRSNRDYSRSNSTGSRGVYLWFVIESEKLYEVHKRVSRKNTHNYFCAVTAAGDIYTLTDQEATEWLNAL